MQIYILNLIYSPEFMWRLMYLYSLKHLISLFLFIQCHRICPILLITHETIYIFKESLYKIGSLDNQRRSMTSLM